MHFTKMHLINRTKRICTQQGASLVEFVIVAPVLAMMGMGTLQAGLLYHHKSILNYATYEAARVGATRHAQHKPMRKELGIRLAPIIGGDGSLEKAAIAMGRTVFEVDSPIRLNGAVAPPTKLEILSPDLDAFADWGQISLEHNNNRRVIPNSHLKHQGNVVLGGLTLQDANLLKIEVTHGVELKVPLIGKMVAKVMEKFDNDAEHRLHYLSGRFPLKSTATVRMQSEAWEGSIIEANEKPYGEQVATLSDIADEIETAVEDALDDSDEDDLVDCGEDGLGADDPPLSNPLPDENPGGPGNSDPLDLGGSGGEPPLGTCVAPIIEPPTGGEDGEC